jgi:hypothetical protein
MNQPEAPANQPEPSEDDRLSHSLTAAQLEKLNLEIRELREKPRWLEVVLEALPMVTVLVTVLGGMITFSVAMYQYHDGQKKARANEQAERRLKVQTQMRNDLDQIVAFPTDTKQTVTRISFLLDDLQQFQTINIGATDTPQGGGPRTISKILGQLVSDDTNFNEPRGVDFAVTMLDHWPDYSAYLKEDQDLVANILSRHTDALQELHRKAPNYFRQIEYDRTTEQYHEPPNPSATRAQFRHFEKLMDGFSRHLEILQDQQSKEKFVKHFQAAICNKDLTQKIFNLSFDPKTDPKAFDECGKHK